LKKKKALVFFSSGLGDALLLIPLVNALRKDGYIVTGLFTSNFDCENLFTHSRLLDKIVVKKNKYSLWRFALLRFRKYNTVYLNYFSISKSNNIAAAILGRQVRTYLTHKPAPVFSHFRYTMVRTDTHDALQNLMLYNGLATLKDLDFNYHYQNTNSIRNELAAKYVIVQVSSGNNQTPYKNWDAKYWIQFLDYLNEKIKDYQIVLLGDKNENQINSEILKTERKNVLSLIGQTSIAEAVEICANASFYIGLDSAFMHLAFVFGKPTFSIWGASSPVLYGYQWHNAKQHHIVSKHVNCAPCNAWHGANKIRVTNPKDCPDFICIKTLSPEKVIAAFDVFAEENGF
jgi:ADP-heptose:LPS heptosyltransferase